MSPRLTLLLAVAALLALPTAALGATKHGITPKSPKAGSTIPSRQSPTLKGRVKGPGKVFVHVCKSKKKDDTGVICSDAAIQQAKKKNGKFSAKLKFFDFSGSWLNNPGTYYWQAFRIACVVGSDLSDCNQEGPIVKFKVG
jgi:hypothetical protein